MDGERWWGQHNRNPKAEQINNIFVQGTNFGTIGIKYMKKKSKN